jgi:hypothetical protein
VGLALISSVVNAFGKCVLEAGNYAVLVEGEIYPVDVSLTPFYDPKNLRMVG